jgi:hypothetical protein
MSFLWINLALAAWTFLDARKRKASLGWAVGVAIVSVLVLPFYLASRPLLPGEVRSGGKGWNVLRHFAWLWTVVMAVATVAGMSSAASTVSKAGSEAEQAGAAIGSVLGLGLMGALWFGVMFGALVLGLFLKNSAVVERGPELNVP